MVITIEFGLPLLEKPFYYKAAFKDKVYRRCGIWFVAISWINLSDKEIHDHIASGKTYWSTK